jgi:tRNA nucleotidyltransferase (CCA-adding enzyme)
VLLAGGKVEITTFRRESGYADGRHPDAVSFDAELTEDLGRRDFTMNAMALSAEGALIDPFGGREDLARKLIRCVGDPAERFGEDALRMLRAVRFSAQMDFKIEEATLRSIAACAGLTAKVSAERVRAEVEKTITAPHPERGNPLFTLGLAAPWLDGPVAPDLSRLASLPPEPDCRWSALCVLLGGTDFLTSLKPDRGTLLTCAGVLRVIGSPPDSDAEWRALLAREGRRTAVIASALWERGVELRRILAQNPCVTVGQLALAGAGLKALGLSGPGIGEMQRRLLSHVLEHPEDNEITALRRLVAVYSAAGKPEEPPPDEL